jgi:hypothetical protein
MKTTLAFLATLAPLAVAAANFPVEVEAQMNGLPITVQASSGIPLVLTFVSTATVDATCKAAIASGLDTPQDRTVTAKAGKSTALPFTLRSTPNRVRVSVACVPKAGRP